MGTNNNLPSGLDWHGWTKRQGSKVEYFDKENISCKCTIPCKSCGFNYLAADGGCLDLNENGTPIETEKTPLCGVW